MDKKYLLGIVATLLIAFSLSSCEAMKARKCGECPDFKRKKKKKYRGHVEGIQTPNFDAISIFEQA